jgi:hypothetical protein
MHQWTDYDETLEGLQKVFTSLSHVYVISLSPPIPSYNKFPEMGWSNSSRSTYNMKGIIKFREEIGI